MSSQCIYKYSISDPIGQRQDCAQIALTSIFVDAFILPGEVSCSFLCASSPSRPLVFDKCNARHHRRSNLVLPPPLASPTPTPTPHRSKSKHSSQPAPSPTPTPSATLPEAGCGDGGILGWPVVLLGGGAVLAAGLALWGKGGGEPDLS